MLRTYFLAVGTRPSLGVVRNLRVRLSNVRHRVARTLPAGINVASYAVYANRKTLDLIVTAAAMLRAGEPD